jgi:hypothetical protein
MITASYDGSADLGVSSTKPQVAMPIFLEWRELLQRG